MPGTLRESGQTVLPMKASMLAMVVNFIFNALLIFGIGPFPRMGVAGAAIATVLSRFVELAIVVVGAHRSSDRYPFLRGYLQQLCDPRRAGAGHPDPLHAAAGQRADVGCQGRPCCCSATRCAAFRQWPR